METLTGVAAALSGLALVGSLVTLIVVPFVYCEDERWIGLGVAVMVFVGVGIASFVVGILAELGLPDVWSNGLIAATCGVGAVMAGSMAYGIRESQLDDRHGTKCLKCGRRGPVQEQSTSSSYATTMLETRRTTHYSADGDVTGYSETEVEVPAVLPQRPTPTGAPRVGIRGPADRFRWPPTILGLTAA
jgi:hypothetical protein